MRRLASGVLAGLLVGGCAFGWDLQSEKSLGVLTGGAETWQRELSADGRTLQLHGVSFRASDYGFRVLDFPPPGQSKLAEAALAGGAVAGCNASYFHEDYRPLGLVVSGGKTVHPLERAKLLSGILVVRKGGVELVRPSAFRPGDDVLEAVQAGPWLVEDGKAIAGLDDTKRARRTLIATDGRGRWAMVVTSPATLSAAAAAIASGTAIPGWKVASALNLDGGSSTALWADTRPSPLLIPEFGLVRNFVVIVPRN